MTPKQIFEHQIAKRLSDPEQAAKAKEIDAVYQFHITGDDGGDWIVDLQEAVKRYRMKYGRKPLKAYRHRTSKGQVWSFEHDTRD